MKGEASGLRPRRSNWRGLLSGLASLGAATLILAGLQIVSAEASMTSSGSTLGHVGRWITDRRGRVVILHGFNMVAKRPPYEPAADGFGLAAARTLEDNGFDVVRLGVIYAAVEPEPGVIDRGYLRSIARTVSLLGRHGVYSLLDFHQDQMAEEFGGEGFPAWSVETSQLPVQKYIFPTGYTNSPALNAAFGNFWRNAPGPRGVGLQQRYVAALQALAREFANDPWVIGYDLFNEPWPAHATDRDLAVFYRRAIAGIRSVDRQHLIWYEPFVLFNFGIKTDLGSFSDPRLGMSFHDYCLGNAVLDPTGCAKSEELTLTNALAHAKATDVALMMTEFGASDDYAELRNLVSMSDADRLPWIEWSYCGCADPTGSIPPAIEGLVGNPAQPGSGSNVNAAKLAVLAEPYPRVVSGTPMSYGFSPATEIFHLTYSTTAPNHHRFTARACTAILVPEARYPRGYRVSVHGGRVASRAGAGVLEIDQAAGARTVSVTVTAGHGGRTGSDGPIPASCT